VYEIDDAYTIKHRFYKSNSDIFSITAFMTTLYSGISPLDTAYLAWRDLSVRFKVAVQRHLVGWHGVFFIVMLIKSTYIIKLV